jgi:D-alanyl-D-alanine carboxypeptidase (penicillin-binding protein 5/6)
MRIELRTVLAAALLSALASGVAGGATKVRAKKAVAAKPEATPAALVVTGKNEAVPLVRAAAFVVVDADRRTILHSKNPDEVRPAASTQKLLTALIVVEEGNLERAVSIQASDTMAEPTKLYFKTGDLYTRRALLEALLVHSMNDAAVALARDNAGDVASFAAKMNAKARAIGMANSRFVNPNGLPAKGQYSTARDLARLGLAAYENPVIRSIVNKEAIAFRYYDGRVRTFRNTNKLLGKVEWVNGMKTGYTNAAGKCLIASGKWGARDMIVVLLGDSSSTIWQDASSLLAWGFSN